MKSVVFEVWGEVIAPMDLVQSQQPKGEGPGATSVVLMGMVNMIPAQESLKERKHICLDKLEVPTRRGHTPQMVVKV